MFMPQAANSACGMEMIMEEKDTELRDEGLRGNEKIEEAIAGLQQEPTQEMLAHALTVVRRRMKENGQLIVAVEPPAGGGQLLLQTVKTSDGKLWWAAFTGFEEELRGSDRVKSTFLADMGQLFATALQADGVEGIILNPWNRTLMLEKELIRIILGQQELQRISRWICGRKRGNEMITGVHHVCVKCRPEELEKVQKFYGELLGLPLVRSWGEPKVEGLMYGAGTSLIEIFPNAEEDLPQGAIRHFALATDDVDSIVETVRKAGYAVTMEPVNIEIMSKPSLPARIAFIIGPVGEEIELFCEKQ